MENLHVTYFPMEQKYSVWNHKHKFIKGWFNSREEAEQWISGNYTHKPLIYSIELIWNREFNWAHYTTKAELSEATQLAESLANSGDGARVKKIRVRDLTTDRVVFTA